ncbi:hypothetical protein BJ944DRAFT_259062 [Cunninghamella echinulata]|nr:hypothetical protein BJ944DRAFT_259062 [Cunninghamella echinulata]
MKGKVVIFLVIFLLNSVYGIKTPFDLGKPGLGGDVSDAILVIADWFGHSDNWCSTHQCAHSPFACVVKCDMYRNRCCNNAEGLQKCICERTKGFLSNCEKIDSYIQSHPGCGYK